MKIQATDNVKNIPDGVLDFLFESFGFYCDEEFPMPWDAGIQVEGDKIVIEGGILPGGGAANSHATLTLTPADFNKYVRFESRITEDAIPEGMIEKIQEAGWKVVF